MNPTRQLELGLLEHDIQPEHLSDAARRTIGDAAAVVLSCGDDAVGAAERAVSAALGITGFERGLYFEFRKGQPLAETVVPRLAVVRESDGFRALDASMEGVAAAVVQTAIDADGPVANSAEAREDARATLSCPIVLTHETFGLLLLEGSTADDTSMDVAFASFAEFATRCLPLVSRAYALGELRRLGGAAPEQVDDEQVDALDGEAPSSYYGMIGRDAKIEKIIQVAEKVKNNDLNLCIVGESGTGKEILARAIHLAGNRSEHRFVGENCGAISETLLESELFGHVKGAFTGADEDRQGLFELASGGTLFLDEIGDMSEGMQRKLLRVLQEGVIRPIGSKETIAVDVRVISASNRDLQILVQEGRFRADLFYRLNVIGIELPPLRDRAADIPLLADHFTREVCAEEGFTRRFSPSALTAFEQYTWPGNVRELRNVVRRALLTASRRTVARKEVAPLLQASGPVSHSGRDIVREEGGIVLRIPARETFNEIIDECERIVLTHALEECAWNKSKVTKVLKIPRQSLYNKIAKYDLSRSWDDPAAH